MKCNNKHCEKKNDCANWDETEGDNQFRHADDSRYGYIKCANLKPNKITFNG